MAQHTCPLCLSAKLNPPLQVSAAIRIRLCAKTISQGKIEHMTIYIVVITDRHSDNELEPYLDQSSALARAKEATDEMVNHYRVDSDDLDTEINRAMERDGWLYYASLEDAGTVYVQAREIKG